MGYFDDPNNIMQLLNMSAGFGQAAMPSRMPIPTGAAIGMGAAGLGQGMQAGQQYTSSGIANQVAKLGLQRQQTLQPYQLSAMVNALGGQSAPNGQPSGPSPGSSSGIPGSLAGGANSNDYLNNMLRYGQLKFGMTGDPTELEKAYQSAYEHDPDLMGRIEGAKQGKTFFKTPMGTYVTGDQMNSKGGLPTPPTPSAFDNIDPTSARVEPVTASSLSSIDPRGLQGSETLPKKSSNIAPDLMSSDGKPIIPNLQNGVFYKPDPSKTPLVNTTPTSNTETGVAAATENAKQQIGKAYKDNETFTSSLSSLEGEQYRIKQLMDIYQQTQSGTALAQLPDLANKLVGAGVISDPKTIKSLSDVQTAAANHVLQIIQQIKDTNQNLGNAPTRVFGSEIGEMLDQGESAKNQPEALYKLLTQAQGIVDHHIDMVNGWNKIGGLGNRLAGGKTLMPDDYAQQFMLNHKIDDYRKKVEKNTVPFRGMTGNDGPQPAGKIHIQAPDGRTGYIDSSHLEDLLKAGGKQLP